jgi:NAD(P)-dependent dehydrogenase (short-subunit alcohol dehydrogenase family)
MSSRLSGKVLLITGSTTGIGAAMARRFVAEGARVLVHGLQRDSGEELVEELGPDRARLHIDDLTDATSASRLVSATVDAFGGIDGIVNNAAWMVRSNLETTDAALFDRCLAVNARAPLLLVQAGLSHLERSRGAVLNIGSVNAYCGEPNLLVYSMSKGALMTMTRNLSDALGRRHVRVNQMNLGWVLSDNEYKLKVKEGLPADWPEHVPASFAPSGRILTPEQVATAAVYWVSDESRPVSGTVMELEQYPVIGRNPVKD